MKKIFSFTLAGKPVPFVHHSGNGRKSWDSQIELKKRLSFELKDQLNKYHRYRPFDGPLAVNYKFYFPIPKSKLKRFNSDPLQYWVHIQRPDIDNLQKLYNDVLQIAGVIQDDCLIFDIHCLKFYSPLPRVEIEIALIPEAIL